MKRSIKHTHLKVFVTVAELGSVSAAAARLYRSPSAISMTVTNLEDQFKRSLFETGGKTKLTPFGQFVFNEARDQVNRFEHSLAGIEAYARNDFGRAAIAAVPSFASHYLPKLLTEFVDQYSSITLSIRDDNSNHINKMVERGSIDVGIASPASHIQGVHYQHLLSDPIGIVCSHSHPLASYNKSLSWSDLQPYNFISNVTCDLIESSEFQIIRESAEIDVENTTSLLALVAVGIGVTTLPRLAVPASNEDVVFIPTTYKNLVRGIGIITPAERTLSPAAAAFVTCVSNNSNRFS